DKCHMAPGGILRREDSDLYSWVLWPTAGMSKDKIKETQRRVSQHYQTDKTVCDKARIIRLAGFVSHKREQPTHYLFEKGPGEHNTVPGRYEDHDKGMPKLERSKIKRGDGGDDCISEKRLRFALKHINPECDRVKWIGILGAIKDAKIGRADGTY